MDFDTIDPDEVLNAVAEASRRAILAHKLAGDPIVVERDGKVVEIPAAEIQVPDPPPGWSASGWTKR